MRKKWCRNWNNWRLLKTVMLIVHQVDRIYFLISYCTSCMYIPFAIIYLFIELKIFENKISAFVFILVFWCQLIYGWPLRNLTDFHFFSLNRLSYSFVTCLVISNITLIITEISCISMPWFSFSHCIKCHQQEQFVTYCNLVY